MLLTSVLLALVARVVATVSNEDVTRIVVATSNAFNARCVHLVDVAMTTQSRLQIVTVHKMLARFDMMTRSSSEEELMDFMAPSSRFSCAHNRPLIVVLPSSRATLFARLTQLPTHPRWLVFSGEVRAHLPDLLQGLHVPFDCELLVASGAGADVLLTEAYHVSPGSPLQWARLAVWSPTGGLRPSRPPFLYARRRDLHGLVLKAAVMRCEPILTWKVDETTEQITTGGYLGKIWTLLEQLCNFRTEFSNPPEDDDQFGIPLANGSWTGGVGMVVDRVTEFAISDFTITKERVEVVSYLSTLLISGTHIIVRKPNSKRLEWTNFLTPFSPGLWSAILLSVALLGVALSSVRSVGRRHGNEVAESLEPADRVADSLLQVAGLFCQQGQHKTPSAASARVVFLAASVTSVVVLASYSASLISTLTNQKFDLPFTSLEGLAEDSRFKIVVLDKILIATLFDGKPNKFDKLKQRYFLELPPLEQLCSEHLAFVATQLSASTALLKALPCDTVWLDENIFTQHGSIIAAKDSHYRGLLNYYLTRLRDAGIIKQLYFTFWPRAASSATEADLEVVDLAQVLPALATLTAGLVLGVLMLVAERYRAMQPTQERHVV